MFITEKSPVRAVEEFRDDVPPPFGSVGNAADVVEIAAIAAVEVVDAFG